MRTVSTCVLLLLSVYSGHSQSSDEPFSEARLLVAAGKLSDAETTSQLPQRESIFSMAPIPPQKCPTPFLRPAP
jgi:hypothetical protein